MNVKNDIFNGTKGVIFKNRYEHLVSFQKLNTMIHLSQLDTSVTETPFIFSWTLDAERGETKTDPHS